MLGSGATTIKVWNPFKRHDHLMAISIQQKDGGEEEPSPT